MADTHLMISQYGSRERGEDFFKAALDAVRACAFKVDVICHCGDILNCPRPPAKVLKQLIELDRELRELGIPMLAVTGNHDWSTPTWNEVVGNAPESDTIPDDASGIIPIDNKTVKFRGVTFCGLQQMTPRKFVDNLESIQARIAGADVVLFHGTVQGVVPMFVPGTHQIVPDMFGAAKVVLLGDLHKEGYVRTSSGGLIGYCGSSEMSDASEDKQKFVPVIDLGSAVVVNRLPIATREFIFETIESEADVDKCVNAIRAASRPVVVLKYERSLQKSMAKIWSTVGPDVLLRAYPLPKDKETAKAIKLAEGDTRDFRFFVAQRFLSRPDLAHVADELAVNGKDDGFNIISKFIEDRTKAEQ